MHKTFKHCCRLKLNGLFILFEQYDSHVSAYPNFLNTGPLQRPKLNLKPRTAPKEEVTSGAPAPSSRAASIFGGAKPVDTAAREREVEERLQKEQEKMQRHLEDDRPRQIDRKPRER